MSVGEEFLLYPNPKQITSLPLDQAATAIFSELSGLAEMEVPDFERSMGLGQLARRMDVPGVEAWLTDWLQPPLLAARHDTAGLFLWGYWTRRVPAEPLVDALLQGLKAFAEQPACDSLVMALSNSFLGTTSRALKLRIRERFAELAPREAQFQPSVRTALKEVLESEDVQ